MKQNFFIPVIVIIVLILGPVTGPAWSANDHGIRYICSTQIYEAFENSRLDAFTRETGIKVDLFTASSASCIYRVTKGKPDSACCLKL